MTTNSSQANNWSLIHRKNVDPYNIYLSTMFIENIKSVNNNIIKGVEISSILYKIYNI